MSKEDGRLTPEEAMGSKGCGAGTENACFSLTMGKNGYNCSMIINPPLALITGIRLGWRVNVDEKDKKPRCPLGVLSNSKTE